MALPAADLVVCWPGKTSGEYAKIGVAEYLGRIRRFRPCDCLEVSEEPSGKHYSDVHRIEREGRAILKRLGPRRPYFLVVVDPRGKMMNSPEFARFLERQCYNDTRALVFVVGGPDGVSSQVRSAADLLLGVSAMTLPHDMARLVLTEQIYRGFTMIRGLPYNR